MTASERMLLRSKPSRRRGAAKDDRYRPRRHAGSPAWAEAKRTRKAHRATLGLRPQNRNERALILLDNGRLKYDTPQAQVELLIR